LQAFVESIKALFGHGKINIFLKNLIEDHPNKRCETAEGATHQITLSNKGDIS
jgi:hypothetical protein